MNARERIGLQIVRLRQERGLTQRDLANLTGVTQSNIWKIETGKYSVSLDILSRITESLGAKVELVKTENHQK